MLVACGPHEVPSRPTCPAGTALAPPRGVLCSDAPEALDFGRAVVGMPATREVTLEAFGWPVMVVGGAPSSGVGGLMLDTDRLQVHPGDPQTVRVMVVPSVPGVQMGVFEMVCDGWPSIWSREFVVEGVAPCLSVQPEILDFGVVEPGDTACRELVLQSCVDLPEAITEVVSFASILTEDLDPPVVVPGDEAVVSSVCVTPPDGEPHAARLVYRSGSQTVGEVRWMVNQPE